MSRYYFISLTSVSCTTFWNERLPWNDYCSSWNRHFRAISGLVRVTEILFTALCSDLCQSYLENREVSGPRSKKWADEVLSEERGQHRGHLGMLVNIPEMQRINNAYGPQYRKWAGITEQLEWLKGDQASRCETHGHSPPRDGSSVHHRKRTSVRHQMMRQLHLAACLE